MIRIKNSQLKISPSIEIWDLKKMNINLFQVWNLEFFILECPFQSLEFGILKIWNLKIKGTFPQDLQEGS